MLGVAREQPSGEDPAEHRHRQEEREQLDDRRQYREPHAAGDPEPEQDGVTGHVGRERPAL
jgi:hypothetical protein